jgi:hypothetical protein
VSIPENLRLMQQLAEKSGSMGWVVSAIRAHNPPQQLFSDGFYGFTA